MSQTPNAKNEQHAPEHSNFKEKDRKRRSKLDPVGRNFECGCGKMYLSYPALYTHIKTKHGGINPEGTSAPEPVVKKRGKKTHRDEFN